MRFAKYHGLGNDFLVVDLRTASADEAKAAQDPETVRALCDRGFGVGGDGVLAILSAPNADARMRVLNSDGSEAEMCGNGIRCVAKELFDRGGIRNPTLEIETGAGRLTCAIEAVGGSTRSVTVDMGSPRLLRGQIPMAGPPDERCIDQRLELPGSAPASGLAITAVSMGNPHVIAFVTSRDEAWKLATTLGPSIETHSWFPQRTNAELAYVKSRREIDLVVWERGCGITLACGTGACATVVAAILNGLVDETAPILVSLPGGTLEISVVRDVDHLMAVRMKGPAQLVFDGEVALDQLARRPA